MAVNRQQTGSAPQRNDMKIPAEAAVRFLRIRERFDVQVPLEGKVRPSSIALFLFMRNDHFLNLKMFFANSHSGKGNLLVKAPTSKTAGVQPQNAIPLLTGVLIGMTVNHHIRKGTFHSYVENGQELETAQMNRVSAGKFIVNITFGLEHAVAITDKNDFGKLISHRFPKFHSTKT